MSLNITISLVSFLIFLIGLGTIQVVLAETGDENINFFLDKISYEPRDSIHVEGWVNTVNAAGIRIEIINPNNLLIYHDKVSLADIQEIDHSIPTFGQEWNVGGFYQIRVSYEGETQSRLFAFGDFDPKEFEPEIKLDKQVYSWTDTVKIMITSPNDNQNEHQIEKIKIDISTRAGTLSSYILEEIGFSHGVFSGFVTLTGHSDYDVNGDGRDGDAWGFTQGGGPEEGSLSAHPNDTIEVSFSTPFFAETLEEYALVQFQKGIVEWAEQPILPNQKTVVRVIDPDMNIRPEFNDQVSVLVWSYPHQYSKEYVLRETAKNSGIFEGKVQLVSSSDEKGLLARSGSFVSLKYEDNSLPRDFLVKTLDIITNATVGEQIVPEEIPPVTKIPPWVKNTAKWWSEDSIGDDGFLKGVEYLIEKEIIIFDYQPIDFPNKLQYVPEWIKNTARWWAQDKITDDEFVKGIQHLLELGVILY